MKYVPKEIKGNVNISRNSPLKDFFVLLGGLLGIILIVYMSLGLAVDYIVPRLSIDIENKIGAVFSEAFEYEDSQSEKQVKVKRILDDLLKLLPEDSRKYTVNIVNDSKSNAVALPGGKILIFSNLLKEVDSEEGLAFVLAHELGHFANRDHLKGLGRGLVMLAISSTLLGTNSSVTEIIINSLVGIERKFSQHQESEADLWAIDLFYKRYGYTTGATDFFKIMAKKEKKGRLAYYFATHPYTEDRIKRIDEYVKSPTMNKQ